MKELNVLQGLKSNFLGSAPRWYKMTIITFLAINPFIMWGLGKQASGWMLILEFIFTLAMALKAYPLPVSGLLVIEAILMGLTSPEAVYHEVTANLPVILLLIFMVAGIHFMKEGLVHLFSKVMVKVRSKVALSFFFVLMGAVLSAFLDALTVTAVIIAVAHGFYHLFHKYAHGELSEKNQQDLDAFRGFLRNLMMHGLVGTALGGATTLVGEPQNLMIGHMMGWNFVDFFIKSAPVSIPVLLVGLVTTLGLESCGVLGYGYQLPEAVRGVMAAEIEQKEQAMDSRAYARLMVMVFVGILLLVSLAFHLAEVGLIGLMMIILLTALNGVTEEKRIGHAFEEALPFASLLVVFLAVVAVIQEQQLFKPIIQLALSLEGQTQLAAFFMATGVLSAISDNVFVASVYMNEIRQVFLAGQLEAGQYAKLAVAINMGTNIPSIATPNGQAAFLFLLTSSLAPLIKLSYKEMVKLALPYTLVLTLTGIIATVVLL